MAQTGFTPISIYYSTTAAAAPTAGNLVAGELAINTADGKLFYKDSSGVVQVIGTKGGVGSSTTTQVLYNSSGLVVGSANMVFDGSTLTTLNSAYTGTLTGGTGVVNIGSGQFYKDASGNVGIGTSSPSTYGKFAVQTQSGNTPTIAITADGLNPKLNHFITDSTSVLRNLNQIQFVAGSSDISNYQGYMTFSTMGSAGGTITERMRIPATGGLQVVSSISVGNANPTTSGAGITFPATQSASSNANTLDDYEEGTFTPTLGGTATYNNVQGNYTKIGNLVYCYILMAVNTIGTGSTTNIFGLPYTSSARGQGSLSYFSNLSKSVVFLSPFPDGVGVKFEGTTAATPNSTDPLDIFQNSTYVILAVTYYTTT